MGLDQLGVLTVGMFVPKGGGHTLPCITLLPFPLLCRKPPLRAGSPKVIALGHVPCNTWSKRHSLTLQNTGMGVQGTTEEGAGLHKQQMRRCLRTDPD